VLSDGSVVSILYNQAGELRRGECGYGLVGTNSIFWPGSDNAILLADVNGDGGRM